MGLQGALILPGIEEPRSKLRGMRSLLRFNEKEIGWKGGAPMTDRQPRIMALANEKGGVGKTVGVINLAAALVQRGLKVLVVDMDPQANATRGLGIGAAATRLSIYDVILKAPSVPVTGVITNTAWPGLDIIPSHIDLSGAEVELVDKTGRENRLKAAFENVCLDYDMILIDTPPSLSLLTVNVFAFAGEVLVPCQTHPYAYDALAELFDTIEAIQAEINPALRVFGIVATFFDRRTRVSHAILEKLQTSEKYGPLLLSTVIRINTTIAESAAAGMPAVYFRPASSGALDFMRLAEEVAGRP